MLLALGVASLAVPNLMFAQGSEPIRIGLLAAKTGPLASGGIDMDLALTMFLKERNNTLAGRKVELIVADTAGVPATARTKHVGALGAGSTVKLAVNLPLLVYWQALGESLAICQSLNLPADRLIDILSDTAGTPTAMKGRGAAIAKVLAGAPPGPAAFGLSAARRDLATAVQFANTFSTELPVAASALACFEEAEAAGLGNADATTISTRWQQRPAKSKP